MASIYLDWRGYRVTPKELRALKYIVEANKEEGTTVDDARHLFDGDTIASRRVLHTLAKKKLLTKRVMKQIGTWGEGRILRRVAYFYPPKIKANG